MAPIERDDLYIGAAARSGLDYAPLVWAPSDSRCEAIVIVPVKDEAETIRGMLRSLAHQRDLIGRPFDHARYEVLLLCTNCTDESAYLARQFARQYPSFALHVIELTLPGAQASVGHARRLLMDEAYRRLRALDRSQGIICTTDGDTRVAPTWLAATLDAVLYGADAVGGRILMSAAERARMPAALRSRYLRDTAYQYLVAELEALIDPDPHDPWPRHHQHFGASIALTAAMYGRIGGLPVVPAHEDVELHRALLRVDARIRHTPAVRGVVSARRIGRSSYGMAATLPAWEAQGDTPSTYLVEDLSTLERRFRARRQLRVLWQGMQCGNLLAGDETAIVAHAHGVESDWLTCALRRFESFGTLHEATIARRYEEGRAAHPPLVNLAVALPQLRARLAPWRAAQLQLLAARQPLPEVEPVRRHPLADMVIETSSFPALKAPMHVVSTQDTVIDLGCPMDEEYVPSRYEMRRDPRPDPGQIIQ